MAMTGRERAVYAKYDDTSCINPKRGMPKRAKRHSRKVMRQAYVKELREMQTGQRRV